MTANSPEVIYLIDTGDGVAWCDDPDPTGDGECDDAVKYVRGDAYEALQAECEHLRKDAERWRQWVPWIRRLNRKPYDLAREISVIDSAMEGGQP